MTFQEAAEGFITEYSKKLLEQGLTPGISWIDGRDQTAYIGSVESTPGTYGASTKEAVYHYHYRDTRWCGVSGNI